MAQHATFSVGAIGLSGAQINVLKSLGKITHARDRGGYQIEEGGDVSACNIVIVNADDSDSVIRARALGTLPTPPVLVYYAKETLARQNHPYVLQSLIPTKLLALLDSIVDELRESTEVWKKPALSNAATKSLRATEFHALVVDDSATVRRQLEQELGNFNIQSDSAETGERALELLSLREYDLIFLDVVLPGTDGYRVCKDIRANRATRLTPVIMLTSKSSTFDKVRGSLAGCTTYLTKPVDYALFREMLDRFVKTGAIA